LRHVVVSIGRKQMSEHRGQHDEVEGSILEGEAILARRDAPFGVVMPVVEIGDLKMEVRVARRHSLLTPLDSTPDDVDPFVPALQPPREPDGDPAYAAADVEDVFVRTKTAQIHEEIPKLLSGDPKVTAADEPQAARRRQRIASAEDRIAGVLGRRAEE